MIPIRATPPATELAWTNRLLVGLNLAVFVLQVFLGPRAELLVRVFGFVPRRLLSPHEFGFTYLEGGMTLLTSLFLHGGVVHLLGNMLYLWIFGPSVESRIGHARYALLYVAGGMIGSMTHTILFPTSTVPSIGASGCIAAILGAFLVLQPHARIITLIPLVVSWALTEIPALFFIPVWFGIQFLSGSMALASARSVQGIAGIAWWAHVGGFLFGVFAAMPYRLRGAMHAPSPPA